MTSKQVEGPDGKPVEIILPGEADEATAETFTKATDNADTRAIIQEAVSGMPADINIYAFRHGRDLIVGPSVTGITNLYLETYNRFCEFVECVISDRPHVEPGVPVKEAVVHRVAVRGRIQGHEMTGAAWSVVEEPEFQHRKDGTWVWNKHAVTVATSKARRNVMRDLLKPANVVAFVKDCAMHSRKMLELTERDAALPSGETPKKAQLRARLMSLAAAAIDTGNTAVKNAYIAHIETTILGKKMSESTEQELEAAVKVIEAMIPKMSKEQFRMTVLGGAA